MFPPVQNTNDICYSAGDTSGQHISCGHKALSCVYAQTNHYAITDVIKRHNVSMGAKKELQQLEVPSLLNISESSKMEGVIASRTPKLTGAKI